MDMLAESVKGTVRPETGGVAIRPGEVRSLIDGGSGVRVLDVRTPAEFEAFHIPGAYNVPLDTLVEHREQLRRRIAGPVVLVCRSGARARRAEEALREAGMEGLRVLDGGIMAWEAAGHPVRRSDRARWALERQVRLAAGSLVLLGALGSLILGQPLVWLAAIVGAGLAFSAITDTCGMALVLSKLPYNRGVTCDIREVVRSLAAADGVGSDGIAGIAGNAGGARDEAAAARCA